ncbi:MAG: hypothetical protein V1767_06785 [Chloroflexota bacterium]
MKKHTLDSLWLIPILFAACVVALLFDRWQWGVWRLSAITLVAVIFIAVSLGLLFQKYLVKHFKGFRGVQRYLEIIARFALLPILTVLLTLYILSPNPTSTIPPGLQFNVIAISATLGGLVLAVTFPPKTVTP